MKHIDWKQKLGSRKFWAAAAGFAAAVMAAFGVDNMTIEQVVAMVTAGGVLAAYILGESLVDQAREAHGSAEAAPEKEEG